MPLSSDERINQLANDLIAQFDTLFGLHPGFRPAHAKGIMLNGAFTPSAEAASLTRAPHASRPSSPVTARFSVSTGVPVIPDNDPNASPRGVAIRFHLGEHTHTDIVSHSTDGFPTRNGPEFLEFLRAVGTGDPSGFLSKHPETLAFVQAPKPFPTSYAREAFFGVTAYRFTNKAGESRYGRYRIVPEAGTEYLDDAQAKAQDANYLFHELTKRVSSGPIRFNIQVQVADSSDTVDNATIHWAANRPLAQFGTLSLTAIAPDDETHRRIIFDPIPRVDGIDPSADPLLELRSAIYLISGRRRRQAS
jgi:catalase